MAAYFHCFYFSVLIYFYQEYFEKITRLEFKYACRHFKIYYLTFRLQRLMLGPILLNIFSNDLNDGAGQALRGFAGIT